MKDIQNITRFRKWHITCFKDVSSKKEFMDIITSAKSTKYAIIGEEFAPTTNTKHFHGYFEFENACTLSSIKKLLPTAHIEDAHGTSSQNKTYITKEDKDFIEIGTPMAQSFSKEDIANNVLQYLYNNPTIQLLNIALDIPEFTDYIIKNYKILKDISNDLLAMNKNIVISQKEYNYLIDNKKNCNLIENVFNGDLPFNDN